MGMEKITKIEKIITKKPKYVYDIQISGGSTYILNGIIVHNSQVEFGIEADIPITGTQVIHRKSYRRKGYRRKDGTYIPPTMVKAHDIRYENKRLIGFRPKLSKFEFQDRIFRVIDTIKARKGQFFLTRSVREGLPYLTEDISFLLNRIGKTSHRA